jgi:hypothetical protein
MAIEERDTFRCNNTRCAKLFDPLHEAEWSLRDGGNSDGFFPLVIVGMFLAVLSTCACCCITAYERQEQRKEQAALSAPQGKTEATIESTAAPPSPVVISVAVAGKTSTI